MILTRLAEERDWRSQRGMLTALEGFTDPALVALAGKRAFSEPRDDVRSLWVEALGRSADPEALAVLHQLARIPVPWPAAQAVALALSRHPSADTVDSLLQLLWSSKPGVRSGAHEALVKVTGNRELKADPGSWVEWWNEHREGFAPPGGRNPDDPVVTVPTDAVSVPTYYDIPIRGRRVIFCMDVSASMWGPKIEAAMAELARAVEGLSTANRFNVIFFNEHPYVWREELIPAYPFQKLECVTSFGDLETKKYTNIFDTVERALGFSGLGRFAVPEPPGVDDVFILTDGEPNRGRYRDTPAILSGLSKLDPRRTVRIHAISIGDTPKELMSSIAKQHGGEHAHVEARR
jgi:VWA domain-containing protein/HEAT repeat protein